MGNEGVVKIMDEVTKCPALEELNLSRNRVGDGGAKHIAKILPQCTSLVKFDISFNLVGNPGAQALIEMFESFGKHPSLEEMRLIGNDLGSTIQDELLKT